MITAIIPTRKGSTRLPNKNVADFHGEPLLVRKVRQLRECAMIDRVVVFSDHESWLDMALDAGAYGVHLLPGALTGNHSSFSDLVAHCAAVVGGDVVAWTPCTAPLAGPMIYDEALVQWLDARDRYDSLVTVVPERRFIMKNGRPMNYLPGPMHANSQDLPPLHVWSGALWAAATEDMVRWRYFHGDTPMLYEIPKRCGVDIDDALDLAQAKAWDL